jgi:hypothetical protein
VTRTVSTFWGQIFVFGVRDLKFWLLAYFLILLGCAKFQQDWTTLILDILFFYFLIYQKFKGGTIVKCLISMLSNLAETLHSSAKLKDKELAKI